MNKTENFQPLFSDIASNILDFFGVDVSELKMLNYNLPWVNFVKRSTAMMSYM